MVEMIPVQSSMLAAAGHEGTHCVVEFTNGAHYEAHDVTEQEFTDFMGAKSPGAHFNQHLKRAHAFTPIKKDAEKNEQAG